MKAQCPYCGAGCGLDITSTDRETRIRGDRDHPSSKGDLCSKPLFLPDVMEAGRVPSPLYRQNRDSSFARTSWEKAYHLIEERFHDLAPEEIYFYISGQLFTEESYLINKFVKGFLGTNNIDANSRLCMASAVSGYKLVFGSDGPPGSYSDIDDADGFLFVGSNAAWTHPVPFRKVLNRSREERSAEIITIDPLYTETAEKSDYYIPINAGTDTAFLNGVLFVLHEKGWTDADFISRFTEGFSDALLEAARCPPAVAAGICGIDESEIYRVAEFYAEKKKVISFWCQGLNQSTNGTMKNLALLNLHLATGRINERGTPFSLTGQPNAMGGREVGYLSSGLPGFRDVTSSDDRREIEDIWQIETGKIKAEPGPSVTEAVELMLQGRIKLLWVVCTNPAVSMPNLNKLRTALDSVFLVLQDAYLNETAEYADIILPAAQWGEKEGVMTGSDRTVTHCAGFREPFAESRPDWKVFSDFARVLGDRDMLQYAGSEKILQEFGVTTRGKVCDMPNTSYSNLPKQWGGKWLYSDLQFNTGSKRARFHPASFHLPESSGDDRYSLILITGRTKKQWHTMTRTGKSAALLKGEESPFLLLNPDDASDLGVSEGDNVRLRSRFGSIIIRARIGKIKKGHLFSPFGYGMKGVDTLNAVVSDEVDSISKEPELKYTKVEVIKGDQ